MKCPFCEIEHEGTKVYTTLEKEYFLSVDCHCCYKCFTYIVSGVEMRLRSLKHSLDMKKKGLQPISNEKAKEALEDFHFFNS